MVRPERQFDAECQIHRLAERHSLPAVTTKDVIPPELRGKIHKRQQPDHQT